MPRTLPTTKNNSLLFRRVIGRKRRLGRCNVNVLSTFSVTKLFASFFLDRRLIGLQTLNLLRVAVIVLLRADDLLAEFLILRLFLPVDHHSIRTEHNMHKQRTGQDRNGNGRDAAAQDVYLFQEWPYTLDPRSGKGFGLRCTLHDGAKAVFGARQSGNGWKSLQNVPSAKKRSPDCTSADLTRIRFQLFSELRFDLWGQSEVLALRREGINLITTYDEVAPLPVGEATYRATGPLVAGLRCAELDLR